MSNKSSIQELASDELNSINGGHKGFFYRMGMFAMEGPLLTLGILAGMWEGITEK